MSNLRKAIKDELDSLESLLWLTPHLNQLRIKLLKLQEFLEEAKPDQQPLAETVEFHKN